ncbi:MAG: hypothetical protein FWE76_04550 [Symbiobacteriaceae bacterium]|nr:hypothetical protein [Symbiobacteriaceae bacterium]
MSNINSVEEFDPRDIADSRLIAGIAYFYILFFLPLVVRPNSRFGKFHANQALLLFIVNTVGGGVLRMIPFIGGFAAWIFGFCVLAFGIMGFLNAYEGKARELPFVGHYRLIK